MRTILVKALALLCSVSVAGVFIWKAGQGSDTPATTSTAAETKTGPAEADVLTPELVEFEGFINHGAPITLNPALDDTEPGAPVNIMLSSKNISGPVFSRTVGGVIREAIPEKEADPEDGVDEEAESDDSTSDEP